MSRYKQLGSFHPTSTPLFTPARGIPSVPMPCLPCVAVMSGLALWQAPSAGAAPKSSSVRLEPRLLARLVLPVYSSEHLLLLGRVDGGDTDDEDSARVLPVLLRFRDGEQLLQLNEQVLQAALPAASAAVGVEIAARGRLFELAAAKRLAPWDLLRLGQKSASFHAALLQHLASTGWQPVATSFVSDAGGGVARYREEGDMGTSAEVRTCTMRAGRRLSSRPLPPDAGSHSLAPSSLCLPLRTTGCAGDGTRGRAADGPALSAGGGGRRRRASARARGRRRSCPARLLGCCAAGVCGCHLGGAGLRGGQAAGM